VAEKKQEKRKSRVWIWILVVVVALGLAVGGYLFLGQRQIEEYTGPVEKITVAGARSGALVYVAHDQGFFEENGLDVTIKSFEAGKLAVDALLTGETDMATGAEFVVVSNSFEHDDLRILGVVSAANICKVVARKDRGITQPTDLEGKRIGITKKSAGEFYLGTFLTFNGLTFADVEIADLKPSAIVESMERGTIDAALTWEPHVSQMTDLLQGDAVVWDGQSGQDFYFLLLTREEWLKEHTSAAKRFMRALVQAEEYTKENNELASQIISEHFQVDAQDMQVFWPNHRFDVALPQALLIAMEDEARWRIENNLTAATEIPSYLDYVYLDALEEVKPEVITIIR